MTQTVDVAGTRLSDWISLGVLASWVPRDVVEEAVEATGKSARRRGGKCPPHVMTYFAMGLSLWADEDYEEVWAQITKTLAEWGCWDESQERVTTGGLTQARTETGARAAEGGARAGRAARGDGGHARRVPGAVAEDGHGRPGMGYPGHGGERRGVRLPGLQGRHPGRVSQGQGRDRRRVRVACGGSGGDRAVCLQGQRRAVPGP